MTEIIRGYVIRVTAYQENSAIVTVLTKNGEVSFKARSALKTPSKFSSLIQLYTYADFQLSYKTINGNKTLEAGEIITFLPSLFTDLKTSVLLSFVCETLNIYRDLPNGFEIFDTIFNHLREKNNFATIVAILLKYHMELNGCYLSADECVACGSKKNIVTVVYEEGGFVCCDCNKHLRAPEHSSLYLRNFRYILKANISNIDDFKIDDEVCRPLIIDFLNHLEVNCGICFKSKKLIIECI